MTTLSFPMFFKMRKMFSIGGHTKGIFIKTAIGEAVLLLE